MVDQAGQQDEGLLSADAKPFRPQKAPAGRIPGMVPEDGQHDEYKTPVVVRFCENTVNLCWFVEGSLQRQSRRGRSEHRCLLGCPRYRFADRFMWFHYV